MLSLKEFVGKVDASLKEFLEIQKEYPNVVKIESVNSDSVFESEKKIPYIVTIDAAKFEQIKANKLLKIASHEDLGLVANKILEKRKNTPIEELIVCGDKKSVEYLKTTKETV